MSVWTVRLSEQATVDVAQILDWTLEQFGPMQLASYTDAISDALEDLSQGPQRIDVRRRPELGEGIATLPVARQRRKGRHVLVFRVYEAQYRIEVLRILHERMDWARHLDHCD